jgi:hypothetical protein
MPAFLSSASAVPSSGEAINPEHPVNEATIASMLEVSVHWLRKDRQGNRVIPFIRMGAHLIRYIPARVFESLDQNHTEGGVSRSVMREVQ